MTEQQYNLMVEAKIGVQACRTLYAQKAYRIAASRAYYCMFYVAQALLLELGLSFSKHTAIIAAFAKHYTQTGRIPREFHRHLKRAQEMRGIADYDQTSPIDPVKVNELIEQAEQFVVLGERILGSVSEHHPE